jgi:hypothetical protein
MKLETSDTLKLTHCSGLHSFAIASRVVVWMIRASPEARCQFGVVPDARSAVSC